MPELASLIEVTRNNGKVRMEIDGEEFPWFITEEGVSISVSSNGIPRATITLIADEVKIHDVIDGGIT